MENEYNFIKEKKKQAVRDMPDGLLYELRTVAEKCRVWIRKA